MTLGNPMPNSTATGVAFLDAKLTDWLRRHSDRAVLRNAATFRGVAVVVCSLEDRGRFYRALSVEHWEDAVRNALSIGLDEDFGERAMRVRPSAHRAFTLSLEQWLAYRDEVTP